MRSSESSLKEGQRTQGKLKGEYHERYIIKNGKVYDPKTGLKEMFRCLYKGWRLQTRSPKAKVIDAKGKTVIAGAVEVHAHVAGQKEERRKKLPSGRQTLHHKPTGKTPVCQAV